jgi:hypothetical protein
MEIPGQISAEIDRATLSPVARVPEEVASKIGRDALFRGFFGRMAEIALG